LSFRSILDKEAVRISTMLHFDIEAIRAQVRAMGFVCGAPQEIHQWRINDAESRANLAIEDMALASNEAELFDMLLDEAVPPALSSKIVAGLIERGAGELAA
jgi:hypothetical protein